MPGFSGLASANFLRNFPMQAHGAEMLRLACCLATERGIRVCAPVHDALLIEAPIEEIGATVEATRAAMAEASRIVLSSFEVRTDAKVVRCPERFTDKRGVRMWTAVSEAIEEAEAEEPETSLDIGRVVA